MCGISGYWGHLDVEKAHGMLQAMNDLLAHRGPDGEGLWMGECVGLAHRRLAVIDLASGGQPMASADGRYRIVFNGEIYNYRLLRTELEGCGYRFRTHSDTEVIPAVIDHWGIDQGLLRLRGMFALAVYDQSDDSLLLARDRFGIKPLYIGRAPGLTVFGSEPKALFAAKGLDRRADPTALLDFFTLGAPLSPLTVWSSVRELEPGTWIRLGPQGERAGRFWDLPASRREAPVSETEALDRLERVLVESLKAHLVSDVPVAAFLSGGIDSSVLVAILCRDLLPALETFNMGFDESGYDESHYARMVAHHCGSRHHEVRIVGGEGNAQLLETVLTQYDQPFGDSSCIPTYLICREMARHAKVVISGDGGDELFGGYDRYSLARSLVMLGRIPFAPALISKMAHAVSPFYADLGRRLSKASSFAQGHREEMLCAIHTYFREEELALLFRPGFFRRALDNGGTKDRFSRFVEVNTSDPAEQLMVAEIRSILHADYLRKVDIASSAHGLEVRTPYLDAEVLALALSLPIDMKIRRRSPKHVLRVLARMLLPRDVVDRPKHGFGVPFDRWMDGDIQKYFEDLLLGPFSKNGDWLRTAEVRRVINDFVRGADPAHLSRYQKYQRLFMLAAFELWLRRWSPSLA
jgi:asparagine synthase (glutamine-hydrolysing)